MIARKTTPMDALKAWYRRNFRRTAEEKEAARDLTDRRGRDMRRRSGELRDQIDRLRGGQKPKP
jgi:hypothetical protein